MSESNELYSSVNYIKHKVEAIEKIELLNLRSNKTLKDEYMALLEGDELLCAVYKAIDGIRSQKEISLFLNSNDAQVHRKIKRLSEFGLIEVKTVVGNNKIYKYSIAEQAFKLTKIVK